MQTNTFDIILLYDYESTGTPGNNLYLGLHFCEENKFKIIAKLIWTQKYKLHKNFIVYPEKIEKQGQNNSKDTRVIYYIQRERQ